MSDEILDTGVSARAALRPEKSANHVKLKNIAKVSLNWSGKFWFVNAVAGQMMFAYYIIALYGTAALRGNFEAWNKIMPNGYISGDVVGNLFLALHLLLAAVITIGGPLQLMPQVRRIAPVFHRWNGRIYVLTALVIAPAAVYLKLSREAFGSVFMNAGFMVNAALIVLCAIMAWRYALIRDFATHRRWAWRLFICVSGTWFFRVGFMAWVFINQGPVGHTDDFQGLFDHVWGIMHLLLPLAVLELYLRIQANGTPVARIALATGLFGLTLLMGVGIAMTTKAMWLPHL